MPELWTVLHRVRSAFHRGEAEEADSLVALNGNALDASTPAGAGPDGLALEAAHAAEAAAETARAEKAFAELIGDAAAAALIAARRPGGPPVLAPRRLARAALRLDEAPATDRDRLAAALSGGSPTLAAYLVALLATGRGTDSVEALAARVGPRSRDSGWLHRHLAVLDGRLGPATFSDDDGADLRLRQLSPTTCGPTAVIVMRVLLDPAFALWLTTGVHLDPARPMDGLPFEQRFRSQQSKVHESLTRRAVGPAPWPRFLGSPPWALARFLNRFTGLTGATFGWAPVDSTDPGQLRGAVAAVARGVRAGLPVPLYVGRHVDRHVVLATALEGDGRPNGRLHLYDPAGGEVVGVDVADVLAGRVGVAGWDHLESVVAPRLLDA